MLKKNAYTPAHLYLDNTPYFITSAIYQKRSLLADAVIKLNYLLINPVKHGYCDNLYDYPFSSFHQRFEQSGREALAKQFREHRGYQTLLLDEDDF